MKLSSPVQRRRSRIEMIPLIDIMFFLLASFMMISLQMDQTQNIQVNLPPATQARHDFKPTMLNIAVDKSGGIWVEKKRMSSGELGIVVSNRFKADTNLPVFIGGDRETLEDAMQDVLECVRNAGVQKVALTVGGNEAPSSTNRP